MKKQLMAGARLAAVSMALLVAGGSAANAFVLLPTDPGGKDAIGNRNDIYSQGAKFSQCVVKALQKCEKGQDPVTPQCVLTGSLTAPLTAFSGVDPNSPKIADKFEEDVAKCLGKVDYAKKGAKNTTPVQKYEAIGCPGDCDAGTGGDQRCVGLDEYQDAATASTLDTVNTLGALVPSLAVKQDPPAVDPAGCVPPSSMDPATFDKELKAFDKCITSAVGVVAKYAAAIQKCIAGCEADYKNKKGDGGPNDGPPTCNLAAIVDPAEPFAACTAKALASATKKPLPNNITVALGLVGGALDPSTNNLFNKPDNCS